MESSAVSISVRDSSQANLDQTFSGQHALQKRIIMFCLAQTDAVRCHFRPKTGARGNGTTSISSSLKTLRLHQVEGAKACPTATQPLPRSLSHVASALASQVSTLFLDGVWKKCHQIPNLASFVADIF